MAKYYVDVYVRPGLYKRTGFDTIAKARSKAVSEIEKIHPNVAIAEVDIYYGRQRKYHVFRNKHVTGDMYLFQEIPTNRNYFGHQHTYECFKNGNLGRIVWRN